MERVRYYTKVRQELGQFVLVEIRIHPDDASGCIVARKRRQFGERTIDPATVEISVNFRTYTPDHTETIARWMQQAANVARLLDQLCSDLDKSITVRQVAGSLVVDVAEQAVA